MRGRRADLALASLAAALAACLSAWMGACGRSPSGSGAAAPRTLVVAAAADLQFALDELVEAFGAERPEVAVRVVYGSSGNFHAQLLNRAPFDLYFSADIDYPRRLAAADLALDDDVFRYAVGRIVVWAPRSSSLALEELGVSALAEPSVTKVAIANPEHAPYGRAAVAALRALGLYERVEARLVLGDNVAQAAHFVRSGAADVGIIALSLALAPPLRESGRYVEIPSTAHPPLEQGGLIPAWTRAPDEARALRDFVLGASGRAVLARYGFVLPE